MSEYTQCVNNKKVEFGNDFKTMFEVLDLFGIERRGMGKGVFEIPGNEKGVVCMMTDERKGVRCERNYGSEYDGRGWQEVVSIEEIGIDGNEVVDVSGKECFVFYKMERLGESWWKFLGVFEVGEYIGDHCVYVRKSKEGRL